MMLFYQEESVYTVSAADYEPFSWFILAAIILFWVAVFIITAVNQSRKKQKKKQEDAEYRENHIRTVTFTDLMMFGTIEAEYDTLTGILRAENINLPRFGTQSPNAILVENYRDEDHETVLRRLNTAYMNSQDILLRMAEKMLPLIDPETGTPELNELAEHILVTDFQLSNDQSALSMMIVAGAEYAGETYSLHAVYHPDPVHWEYDAEKMECPEEQWNQDGETTVS